MLARIAAGVVGAIVAGWIAIDWGRIGAMLAIDWTPVATAAAAGIGAAGTAAAAFFAVWRQRSGSVKTSEAAELWAFTTTLMRDLREDLVKARERIAVLEGEREEDRVRISDLEGEVHRLKVGQQP
ncbi:MAG TPA: hypothetical protein VF228_10185 [Iamia sp.]